MSEPQNSSRSSSSKESKEDRSPTPEVLTCESDDAFFQSLHQFIDHEKKYLETPTGGANEQRHFIYRSAFNKVISRSVAYKRIMLTLKQEYDDVIGVLQRREEEGTAAHRAMAATALQTETLRVCRRRAEYLTDRLSALRTETSDLQQQIHRQKTSLEPNMWIIPGITEAESFSSLDPDSLDKHLKHLSSQRDRLLMEIQTDRQTDKGLVDRETDRQTDRALLDRHTDKALMDRQTAKVLVERQTDRQTDRVVVEIQTDRQTDRAVVERQTDLLPVDTQSQCSLSTTQTELEQKLQDKLLHRERLEAENKRQEGRLKRLRFLSERLSSWEKQDSPLEEFISSSTENNETEEDAELFDEGVEESKHLDEYLDRFMELFDSCQFEEASLHAASSPGGILRNMDTLELFEGAPSLPGSLPPPLLFFHSLLMTLPSCDSLPVRLSLRLVGSALTHRDTQLVLHSITHNRLSFSEALGDLLTAHAQTDPVMADVCLALATVVYQSLRLNRQTALSMCRRGLIHSAAEFINHCREITLEDCMIILCFSPSLTLLQLITASDRSALSLCAVCSSTLSHSQLRDLGLGLLDGLVNAGKGVLSERILGDCTSRLEVWTDVACLCQELQRADLHRAVLSVLLEPSGNGLVSPDMEGGRLMEHVYM